MNFTFTWILVFFFHRLVFEFCNQYIIFIESIWITNKFQNEKICRVPTNKCFFYKDYYNNQITTHTNKLIIHSKVLPSMQRKINWKLIHGSKMICLQRSRSKCSMNVLRHRRIRSRGSSRAHKLYHSTARVVLLHFT